MAISIKSLDTRVTALENKLSGSVIGFPDWSKITKIKGRGSRTYEYTATESCWIMILMEYSGRHICYMNGVMIARCTSEGGKWEDNNAILLPVNKGDVIKLEELYYSNSGWMWKIPIKI